MPIRPELLKAIEQLKAMTGMGQPATGGMQPPGADIPLAQPPSNGDPSVASLNSVIDRATQRSGLPGETPHFDPRLVNPNNNPLTSLEGMTRGDINLRTGNEDETNLKRVLQLYKRPQ